MPRNVKIYKMKDLVRRTEAGALDLSRAMAVVYESAAFMAHHPDSNVLIDTRGTEKGMAVSDLLAVASEMAKYRKVFANRLAILGPDERDRMQRTQFLKAAMDVQGFELEIFTDYEAAIDWLSDVATHELGPEECEMMSKNALSTTLEPDVPNNVALQPSAVIET